MFRLCALPRILMICQSLRGVVRSSVSTGHPWELTKEINNSQPTCFLTAVGRFSIQSLSNPQKSSFQELSLAKAFRQIELNTKPLKTSANGLQSTLRSIPFYQLSTCVRLNPSRPKATVLMRKKLNDSTTLIFSAKSFSFSRLTTTKAK